MPFGYKNDPALKLNKYGLTLKQEQFCQAYLIDFNASKAARLSGYKSETGSLLLKKVRIRARIFQIRKETGKKFDVTRERLLQELMKIAYGDARKLANKGNPDDWDDDEAAGVASIEYDQLIGGIRKITKYDKLKAVEIINKMMGFNEPEKAVVTNTNYNSEPMSRDDIKRISKELDDIL